MKELLISIITLVCIITGTISCPAQNNNPLSVPDTILFSFENQDFHFKKNKNNRLEQKIKKELKRHERHQQRLRKTNYKILNRLGKVNPNLDTLASKNIKIQNNKQIQKLNAYNEVLNKELKTNVYNEQLTSLKSSVYEELKQQQWIEQNLSKTDFSKAGNLKVLKQLKVALELKKNLSASFENQEKLEGELLGLLEKYQNNFFKNPYKNISSEEDLVKHGYQTKNQVNKSIADKNNLEEANIQTFIDEKKEKVYSEQTEQLTSLKKNAAEAKQGYQHIKELKDLKINPLRATPIDFKLKPVFSFNIQQRNLITGNNQLVLNAGVESKLLHKLKHGIGINNKFGFNLRKPTYFNLDLSYAYYYLNYDLIWGIGLQAGYEYNFINTITTADNLDIKSDSPIKKFLTNRNQNIGYIGLSKSYHINSKWNGTLLVGYDLLWQKLSPEKNSPWIIRLGFSLK